MRTESQSTNGGLAVYDEEEYLPPELLEPFAVWLDGQLEALDRQWSPWAAPNARRAKFAASQTRA